MYFSVDLDRLMFPKIMIFDFDCTICDSWPQLIQVWNKLRVEYGNAPMSKTEIYALSHVPQGELITQFFTEERAIARYWEIYDEIHQLPPPLLQTAETLLNWSHQNEIDMAIITNSRGDKIRSHCKILGIDRFFIEIIGVGDISECKPNPAVITRTLQKCSIQFESKSLVDYSIWYIGDSPNDILTAKNANIFPVWMTEKATQLVPIMPNEEPGSYPILKINTLGSLKSLLNHLRMKKCHY